MICCVKNRNAEARRTQSSDPSTSSAFSAFSAPPRFKTCPAEHGDVPTLGRYVGANVVDPMASPSPKEWRA